MDYLGKKLASSFAVIQKAQMDTRAEGGAPHPPIPKNVHLIDHEYLRGRYTGVPAIPTDIGYNSGKGAGGSNSSGMMATAASNPVVILGMGLTTLALLGMFRRSLLGDKLGTQKYMKYRVLAQLFTVTALVTGVTFFTTTAAASSEVKSDPQSSVLMTNSGN